MKYVSIDVETANKNRASICQIGIAVFKDHLIVDQYATYIDPEDYFDDFNISIHGITERTVSGAPTFDRITEKIYSYLDGMVAVCHTQFDRVSISQACDCYDVRVPNCKWLDSARIARRTWPEVALRNYGLGNVCKIIGYQFKHHDALEDAKAAGQIVKAASEIAGLDIDGWLNILKTPKNQA